MLMQNYAGVNFDFRRTNQAIFQPNFMQATSQPGFGYYMYNILLVHTN